MRCVITGSRTGCTDSVDCSVDMMSAAPLCSPARQRKYQKVIYIIINQLVIFSIIKHPKTVICPPQHPTDNTERIRYVHFYYFP